MSKIIIHNNSKMPDFMAVSKVKRVMVNGFVSGPNQYCWSTSNTGWSVEAMETRGTTHTFKVEDD